MSRHELWELKQMQSLPLPAKIQMTRYRIKQWVDEFGEDGVYVSFSGGKDSTVLKHITEQDYKNVPSVFIDTGLEYPSVRRFALSFSNVIRLLPSMNIPDVHCKYGYPVISKEVSMSIMEFRKTPNGCRKERFDPNSERNKRLPQYDMSRYSYLLSAPFNISHKCCDVMKKNPSKHYEKLEHKQPIIGVMADESRLRLTKWLIHGCNAFNLKRPQSNPMSFWTENDVLQYIHENNLPIAEAYGDVIVKNDGIDGQINIHDYLGDYRDCQYVTTGCKRTGCIFCMFGITQDKDRFIRLAEQEPRLCDYVMRGGEFNEQGMWKPSKSGLGYWFVIEWLNVHGNLKIGMPDREKYLSEYQTEETRKYLVKEVV